MPDFGGYNMGEKDPGWKDLKIKTAEKNALRIKGLPVGRKQSKLPVIQGGMGVGISLSGLAGAVASCGGVGLISTAQIGFRRPEFDRDPVSANIAAIKEEFQKARKIAPEGIIGFNIMVATHGYETYVKTAAEAGADLIVCGAGLPVDLPAYTAGTPAALAPVISSARAAELICRMWKHRYQRLPDLLIVEGPEAGGHLGFSPEEVEEKGGRRFDEEIKRILAVAEEYGGNEAIPVVLAGGIYDQADVFHAMEELGATGVQIATRLVTTEECDAPSAYKQAYLNAKKEDIVLTKSPVGMPGRAIRNEFLRRAEEEQIPVKACHKCLKKCDPTKIPYCITDALIHAARGEMEDALIFCGSNAWRAEKIECVEDVLRELFPLFFLER